jgi:hypothetical protein
VTFQGFTDAVVSYLLALGCDAEPDVQGYVARWRVGEIGVNLLRTDEGSVLLRLVGPGISVAPVAHPMTVRGVRDVAVVIAAALDGPSDPDLAM